MASCLASRRLVEELIYLSRGLRINSRDLRKIGQACSLNCFHSAKMTQESPLASGPDAWNFLQASLADIFLAPYTMRAYRKAMRFIAQSLVEIEQRISRRQSERVPARHKEG